MNRKPTNRGVMSPYLAFQLATAQHRSASNPTVPTAQATAPIFRTRRPSRHKTADTTSGLMTISQNPCSAASAAGGGSQPHGPSSGQDSA